MLLADGIAPAAGTQFSGTTGTPTTNITVASFTVVDPSGSPGTKWVANIAWGDSLVDRQVQPVEDSPTAFHFAANHTYSTPGTYTVTVMIAVPGSGKPNNNTVSTTAVISQGTKSPSPAGDYDGDGKSDLAVFRPDTDLWGVQYASGGKLLTNFGDPAHHDVSAPGDYDAGGKTGLAVFRPATAQWIIQVPGGPNVVRQFGDPAHGDVPAPGDYEGTGKTDLAVFRPATAQWIIRMADGSTVVRQFGDPAHGDMPAPGDYEGIGKTDLAVFRPATAQWIIRMADGSTVVRQFGDPAHGDMPAPGDYEGIGKTDLAVYRPSTAQWIIRMADKSTVVKQFGDPSQGDTRAGLSSGGMSGTLSSSVRPAPPRIAALTFGTDPSSAPAIVIIPQADSFPWIDPDEGLTHHTSRNRQFSRNA